MILPPLHVLFGLAVLGSTLSPLAASLDRLDQPLSGRVVDQTSGLPIPGATVVLVAARTEVVTDSAGAFAFGEVANLRADTLVVTFPGFRAMRVTLDPAEVATWNLELRMAPLEDGAAREPSRTTALRMALEAGGVLWSYEEFGPFLRYAARPLDALLYSGLVAEITSDGMSTCVRLEPGGACAELRVGGDRGAVSDLGDLLPQQVDSYLVLPPTPEAAALGFPGRGGTVLLYLLEPGE